MNLSDGEKLILIMLCDLHEKLGIKDSVEPKFVKEAIYSGNTWGLKWQYSGIFGIIENPKSVVDEVVDILEMCSFLERSYQNLTTAGKAQVEKDAEPLGQETNAQFFGFDGNNETEHLSVARFLIGELGRFSEFDGKADDLNSHYPTLDVYRRMLAVFVPIRNNIGMRTPPDLTAAEVTTILKARIHPR